jgi:hypothetical protein
VQDRDTRFVAATGTAWRHRGHLVTGWADRIVSPMRLGMRLIQPAAIRSTHRLRLVFHMRPRHMVWVDLLATTSLACVEPLCTTGARTLGSVWRGPQTAQWL